MDDFIVSDHLISLMMAQLSENPDLFAVFTDIFDPEGSEIYLKPAGRLRRDRQTGQFLHRGRGRPPARAPAFGYRLAAESGDASRAYGVHTNPKKSEPVTFGKGDKVIVLAED